jgi:protocatechuate 3,4-dioxygenase beta subunit
MLRKQRDIRREATGTGVISGRVTDDTPEGRPLRRAAVTLSSTALMTSRRATTRDDGSYVFDGLPPGAYGLSVFRSGYMRTEHGARRPGGSGSTLSLAAGQRIADVVIRLPRYSAITGTIYDQDGEPAVGVSVEAMRYTMRTGRRTLSNVYGQPARTDDRGVYRLDGLTPGEYYVAAGPSPSRGPLDVVQLTTTGVDRVLQLLRSPAAPSAAIAAETTRRSYAPVFYPGTTDLAGATIFKLGLGEERGGADMRLQLVTVGRLAGTVTRDDGTPATTGNIVLTPLIEPNSMDLFSPTAIGAGTIDAQGRFEFPAVPPGRYQLVANAPDGKDGRLWGALELTVDGGDRAVAMSLAPGGRISGRVTLSGTTLKPPAGLSSIRVTATASSAHLGTAFATATATVQPDGTFVLASLAPGLYRLSANSPVPPGWAARSLMIGTSDLLDGQLLVRAGTHIVDAVLTYADRPTELSGMLQTPAGDATADYFIVVFSADRSFWTPASRRQTMARPASSGRYAVSNLPPGDYLVAAVTDVEPGSWFDPAFLEQLLPAAVRVTLAEGERRVLDLKIGR